VLCLQDGVLALLASLLLDSFLHGVNTIPTFQISHSATAGRSRPHRCAMS